MAVRPTSAAKERAGHMTGAGRLKHSDQRIEEHPGNTGPPASPRTKSAIKGGQKTITCIPLQLRMGSSARADSDLARQRLARIRRISRDDCDQRW